MLSWKEKKINDLESNPRDCYWAVGKLSEADVSPRLYVIVEQRPCDTKGIVQSDTPELYVLFEGIGGIPANSRDAVHWEKFGDWAFQSRGMYVHAYKTLQEAKERAETQLDHIRGIINEYFQKK